MTRRTDSFAMGGVADMDPATVAEAPLSHAGPLPFSPLAAAARRAPHQTSTHNKHRPRVHSRGRLRHREGASMRRFIIPSLAAVLAAAVLAPSVAHAWPRPAPGQPVCVPNGDGTFTIQTAPENVRELPRGSHQPENGECEGPVVEPTPPPAPPAPPVVEVPVPVPTPVPVPVPTPECGLGTKCCPVCVSKRKRKITLSQYVRVSPRYARVTRWERVRSAKLTYIAPRRDLVHRDGYDRAGRRITVNFRRVNGRLVATINQAGLLATRGQLFVGSIRTVTDTGKVRWQARRWRLCMIADGELDAPSDLRRD